MIVTFKTAIPHEPDVEGDSLAEHCCGCWNVSLDEDRPDRPYAVCNECGEVRAFSAIGVTQPEIAMPRPKPKLSVVSAGGLGDE